MSETTLSPKASKDDAEKAQASVLSVEYLLPEGGRTAWLTMAGAWMVQFCTFGYINAFGVYQDFYTREFLINKTAADISWIGSFQLAVQYAMGVIVSRAVDAGYFHHLMFIGSSLYVLCIFLLSLAKSGEYYQVFLAQAVGMGIFPALIFLPSFTIVSHHFKRRRALAMGIVTSGAACGGVIFPIMLNQIGQHVDFTTAIRVSGGLIGAQLLFANLVMRTNLPPKTPAAKEDSNDQPAAIDWKTLFTDVGYLSALAGAFFTSLGLFFPFFYLQLYAVTNGIDKELAFYLLTILNGGSIFGRLINNAISPRVGSFNLVAGSLYACAILIAVMVKIKTFAGLAVFAFLYGFTSGAYASLMPTNFVGFSNHPGEYGTRLALAFSVVAPAMLVGNPVSGALLGTTGAFTWTRTIIYNAVMVAVGATFVAVARGLYIKRKGTGPWV
ncbi:major facilitator superfamily domain-containing protein [Mycena belliarum]|uniref:Major facilitator superfamily domain-containing protein n=1 Tax=Mycena belliarum TaxID=1033014 RepID=A0AAD6XJP8_9AGAR|nr:major facilitator superfamily domain-containing protein [Mycena belliae]